jgi:two-component system, response regulator / RNA-binding antiterminator
MPVPDSTPDSASVIALQRPANPVIEQAKSIVMAELTCTPDEAFDLLRRASQRANIKVSVLAAHLIDQAPGRS